MRKLKLLIFILLFPFVAVSQYVETKSNRQGVKNYYPRMEKDRQNLDEKMSQYDIKHYFLDLEISPSNTYISGFSEIMARVVVSTMDTIMLELNNYLTIDSIKVDGKFVSDFTHADDEIVIVPPGPISQNEFFTTRVFYHGTSQGGGVSYGYNSTYNKDVTWTLSESFHAKDWWATKQVLEDKADSATVYLTTHEDYTAVSNGNLEGTENLGNSKVKYKWKTHYPINYYLVSYAVADYREYNFYAYPEGINDSIFIQNFVYDNSLYLEGNQSSIDNTKDFIELYSELYGIYPFYEEKYGHSLTELGGGMEHQTVTTTGSFSYNLISHELMHQWFGDYVTFATWQYIWINEGFASYGEYVALEYLTSGSSDDNWMSTAHSYAKSIPDGTVYIPFEEANNEGRIFNYYLSYKKGAALVHMIRYLVNDEVLFFQAMRNFLQEFNNGVATGEDLKNSVSNTSGVNLDAFFDEWYYGKGFPYYDVKWEENGNEKEIIFSQETSANDGIIFSIPVELLLMSGNGEDTLITIHPALEEEKISIEWDHTISDIAIDPDNWVLNGEKDLISGGIATRAPVEVEVFPNPVQNRLNVNLKGENQFPIRYRIMDISGKVVKRGFFKNSVSFIYTESWPAGLYFLEIFENKSHLYKKIIKQ